MKKSFWIFAVLIVAAVFLIEFDVAKRTQARTVSRVGSQASKTRVVAQKSSQAKPNADSNKSAFATKFESATSEISQLQAHPEDTEQKLQDLANQMSSQDIKKLSHVMADTGSSGDERAMAVELLSRRQSIESLKQLEEFVATHEATNQWSRNREFESVLRAQAIEGIASYPQTDLAISSLTALDPKIDESFLKDRIKRSIAGLKKQSESADKQDQEALSKLVE